MSTLFAMMNIASRAMIAQQKNVQVIEQNVTNANTEGYHRQEAVFKNGMPYGDIRFKSSTGGGQFGTGVVVDKIKRFSLEFFDDRYRLELGQNARWEMENKILKQLEATLEETGSDGLIARLDDFWSGWQILNGDPSNTAIRADLRDRAQALVVAFNQRAEQLTMLREDQDLTIQARVDEINEIAKQIAALNREIPRVRSLNNEPNDLLDERDRLLDRLTEVSGMVAKTQENGETIVSIGGHVLVVGTGVNTLSTEIDLTNDNLSRIVWNDGLALNVTSGELEGLFDARDNIIKDQMTGLDQVAQTLHDQVNQAHIHGYSINNPMGFVPPPPPAPLPVDATAYNFFDLKMVPGMISSRLILDSHITDPIDGLGNIAAAAGPNYAPGDGNNALVISDLQRALVLNSNSTSINDYYSEQVASLGLIVSRSKTSAADHASIMKSLGESRDEVSGVSSDEEAVKLMQSQKAYNSAARVLTTVDEMLDRVINNMGRVGI